MATTRIKDISKTTTDLASDTYGVFDGATNGTQKMARNDMYADWAAAYTAAPTTYKLAPLNSGTNKIDATYLPVSGDTPKGEWNASTNSPSLADGSGTAGDYYDVTTAGSQDLGSGSTITFTVGDVVKYNGSTWYKIDSVANFLDGYSTAATSRTALAVNSIDEDAEATATKLVGPALYFDGVNDYLQVADDAKLSFTDGTDDLPFSISAWINANDLTNFSPLAKWDTTGREWLLYFNSSDKLVLNIRDGAAIDDVRTADSATTLEDQWIHVAATYAGAGPNSSNAFTAAMDGATLYINGSAIASTASNNASYAGMTDTGQNVYVGKFTSNHAKGHIRNVQLFNRELTADEVAQLARGTDLGFSSEWGTGVGGIYTSNFSAGADNWGGVNGTADGNIDSVDGQNDNLRFTLSGGAVQHRLTGIGVTEMGLVVGKKYKITFDYYIPSANTACDGIRVFAGTGAAPADSNLTGTYDTWLSRQWEVTWTNASEDYISFFPTDGGATTVNGDGDVFYVRNIRVTQLGNLADFRSERFDSDTGKIYDLSSNGFVGTSANLPTLTGRAYPVYETGTWTPTVQFGGASVGVTYNYSEGVYTRVGNMVTCHGIISLSSKGSSSGSFTVVGIPFTPAAGTFASFNSGSVGYVANMSGLTTQPTLLASSTNALTFFKFGGTAVNNTDVDNSMAIRFSITYRIQ